MIKTIQRRFFKASILLSLFILPACTGMNLVEPQEGEGSQPLETQLEPTAAVKDHLADSEQMAAQSETGTIAGQLIYPEGVGSPVRVVAFDANDPEKFYFTDVYSKDSYLVTVSPGTYFILAYLIEPADASASPGLIGAYSDEMACSLYERCGGQSLMGVRVNPGQQVTGKDLLGWYLPDEQGSDWPGDPTQ